MINVPNDTLKSSQCNRINGFTIVELLIVIVVIGILAAISLVSYTGVSNRANISVLKSDLSNVVKQIKIDTSTTDLLPTSLELLNNGNGVKTSGGVTLDYSYNNDVNPNEYCISATRNFVSYKVINDSDAVEGSCFDYGLLVYLDAGNVDSYPGSGSTWTDLSGNGADGTLHDVTYSSSNGGSLVFNGTTSYISSTLSQNYMDVVVVFNPDFSVTGSSLRGLIASGVNTDKSLRFNNANGVGPWTIQNPGDNNDWAASPNPTTYYVNNSIATQLVSGWNILSAYRTSNASFPADFAYYIGSGYPNRYFKGNVSAVLMFNRRLSAADHQKYFEFFKDRYGL